MPNWTNRTYTNPEKDLHDDDCVTCQYLEDCPNECEGFVILRKQRHCSSYWNKLLDECMNKACAELEMTEEEKSWAKFLDYVTRQNQLNRMFQECSTEPECPSPKPPDWRYYGVNVTIPYERFENVKPKLSIWKRFKNWVLTWADDGTFYPGDR